MANHPRGIFERPKGSGMWWIRYADSAGAERREKAGTKSAALALYRKRKTEALQGRKLPESIRSRSVTFDRLADAALAYSRARKRSYGDDVIRMAKLRQWFGSRPAAEITPQEIERRLTEASEAHRWKPATTNRYKALISLVYRLGVEGGHVPSNPARIVRHRQENNARIRYLLPEEEAALRKVLAADFPANIPELDLALHTGMRLSEQYNLTWDCVNMKVRILTIPRSKHGETRHISLNRPAIQALVALREQGSGSGRVILNERGAPRVSPRNWFEPAVKKAGLKDFTWHCLRHTFASRLVMAGVDLRTVQELMGHKTIQMTTRYAHLAPAHTLAAVEKLESVSTGSITGTGIFDRFAKTSKVVIGPLKSV